MKLYELIAQRELEEAKRQTGVVTTYPASGLVDTRPWVCHKCNLPNSHNNRLCADPKCAAPRPPTQEVAKQPPALVMGMCCAGAEAVMDDDGNPAYDAKQKEEDAADDFSDDTDSDLSDALSLLEDVSNLLDSIRGIRFITPHATGEINRLSQEIDVFLGQYLEDPDVPTHAAATEFVKE